MRNNDSPEIQERRVARLRARFDDPEYLAAHNARTQAAMARLHQDPAHKERMREHGRRHYATVIAPPGVVPITMRTGRVG